MAEKVFASGFEEPVYLTLNGTHYLHGADEGYNWDNLPHRFIYVAPDAVSRGFVRTFLTADKSHSGLVSLFQSQDVRAEGSQNRLSFFGNDEEFGKKVFTRRWLYYPNLNNILSAHTSTAIAGLMELGGGVSVFPQIVNNGTQLIWLLQGLDYKAGPTWEDRLMYLYENLDIPIPLERWFKLDYYVERHETDGKAILWVDDALVFNISGICTKRHSDDWAMKISDIDTYETESGGLNLPLYQWVDDVEVWKGKPSYISSFGKIALIAGAYYLLKGRG